MVKVQTARVMTQSQDDADAADDQLDVVDVFVQNLLKTFILQLFLNIHQPAGSLDITD